MKDFKVRCVSDDGSGAFTAGKIYEFKDGKSKDDAEWVIRYGSVEDLNRNYHSQFELVEESNMFTKEDLQVNDWCVLECGEVCRVAEFNGAKHIIGGKNFWIQLRYFNNSLKMLDKEDSEWNIQRVYRPTSEYMLKEEMYKCGKIVFDRAAGIGCEPPAKEISVDEATKLLTEKFGQNVRIRVGE